MKNAGFLFIMFFLVFSGSSLLTQVPFGSDGFKTNWHIVQSINAGSLRNICHRYTLSFSDEKTGNLSFDISFLSEENQNTNHYYGVVKFTWQVLEEDTVTDKLLIEVAYQEVQLRFQEMPKYVEERIPPDQLAYMEELRQYLTNREEEYGVTLEGNSSLVIEGFSLIKNSSYAWFQKGGLSSDPCKNLIRN